MRFVNVRVLSRTRVNNNHKKYKIRRNAGLDIVTSRKYGCLLYHILYVRDQEYATIHVTFVYSDLQEKVTRSIISEQCKKYKRQVD